MKHLVIAEKPSVARDIARVLGCGKKTNTYMEGKDYIVTWALGHLVTLADPEEYGEQYKSWSMDTLPMLPERWKLVVIRQTSKQYHAVKEQLFRKDVSDVIIATDAGREGELVARWILDKAGNKKPLKRLWISSVTDKAIREGFAHLRPGKNYENLYHAAVARAESDWVVGINATRALTCKYNAQLSCGRVQTPALAMIAAREDEIRRFKPQPYYGLKASAGGITFTWTDSRTGSGRTFDREKVDSIRRGSAKKLHISEVKKKSKKTYSPALYDLTALQREANQRYGYSAKETLNIMQRLYENHKVVTYPRTDSRYLTSDMTGTLKERLKACAVGPYRKTAARLSMQEIRANKSFVDNSKVSDHHAIIPTEEQVDLWRLSGPERNIFDLVARRFLAALLPPFEYEEGFLKLTIDGETFHARVYATESKVDIATRTLAVRASFPNTGSRPLLPGRFVSVQIRMHDIPDAIAVPTEAIVPEMGVDKVYLYKSGKARAVEVRTGLRTDRSIQIIEGLHVGDTLITSGTLQLRTDLPVQLDVVE